jgi:hypothetical protein
MKRTLFCLLVLLAMPMIAEKSQFIAYISSQVEFWPLAKVERAEIEFSNGFKFYVTSNEREAIKIHAAELKKIIEKAFLRNVSNVTRITHNHLVSPDMSAADFDLLNKMREYGFKGQFIIWCQGMEYAY